VRSFLSSRLKPFLLGGSGRQWAPGWIRFNKEWIVMTTNILKAIKAAVKRVARANRLQHITALEVVAREMGQPHWRGLAEAYKMGWRPTQEQLDGLQALLEVKWFTLAIAALGDGLVIAHCLPHDVAPLDADEIHGELDGHPFYLVGDEFSVAFGSQGWEIVLDQPPSAKPEIRRLGGRVKSAAALDPVFVERAVSLLKLRAQRMHAEVAADWPRRSTMPDHKGRALHPLGGGLSAQWHCLHCDGVHDGRTMAKNLWHCPHCTATPIDIFATQFWAESKPLP